MESKHLINHNFKWIFAVILSILVILASALLVTGRAFTQATTAYIEAFAWYDRYALVNWPADVTVYVTIANTDYKDVPFTPDNSEGWYAFYPGVDLQPGSVITATNGEITKELVISSLSASANPNGGVVSGIATPGRTFHMRTNGDNFQLPIEQDITANKAGNWTVTIKSYLPWAWLTRGEMWESDDDGDSTYAIWHVHQEVAEVWLAQNEIRAYDWPLDTELTFNVNGVDIGTTYTQRLFWIEGTSAVLNANDFGLQLEPGMVVTVTDGVTQKSTIVQDIKITSIGIDNDVVSGYAPPDTSLEINSGEDSPAWRFFNADSDGNWTVNYQEPSLNGVTVDLNPGDMVYLFMRETDKDSTVWGISATNPHFTIFPEWEWFDGLDWLAGAKISITIAGKPVCDVTLVSPGGFFNGGFPEGCDVVIGDTVTFTDEVTIRTHTVQNLAITGVDGYDDTVTGTADEGAIVNVWPHATGLQLQATADSESTWQVDFYGIFDLKPNDCGRAQIYDDVGNATGVDWCVPNPYFDVRANNDEISTWNWPLGDLTVKIYSSGEEVDPPDLTVTGTVTGPPPGDPRNYLNFNLKGTFDIQPGYLVTVSDGSTTKSTIVTSLAFDVMDKFADTISGFAVADSNVEVWACDNVTCYNRHVTADGNGNWIADWSEWGPQEDEHNTLDLVGGTWVDSLQGDGDGDNTMYGQNIPNPYFDVRANVDEINTVEWPLGDITVKIYSSGSEVDPPDFSITGTVIGPAPGDPRNMLGFYLNGIFDIQPGYLITVSDGQTTKKSVVTELSFDVMNTVEDTVSGFAAAGSNVDVWACDNVACYTRHVTADANGNWTADWSTWGGQEDEHNTIDLVLGTWVDSRQGDEDGDGTMYGLTIPNPYIEAAPYSDWIHARGWLDGTPVTLTIDDPSNGEGVDYTEYGTMGPAPWNPGDPNDIVADFRWPDQFAPGPGYVISIVGDVYGYPVTKTLSAADLRVLHADPTSNIVYGTATPGSTTVEVCLNRPGTCISRYPPVGLDGNWSVDYVDEDLQSHDNGWLREFDSDLDYTWYDWGVPWLIAFPENEAVEGWEWPNGATIYLTIDKAPEGFVQEGIAAVTTWGDPRTYVRFDFADAYDLKIGDVVTLTDGFTTITHTVQNLSVYALDATNDIIHGSADPGTTIQLWPHGFDQTAFVEAWTGDDGTWHAVFSGLFDLVVGSAGRSQILIDGNATAVDWSVPNSRLTVSITDDWFRAEDFPRNASLHFSIYDQVGFPLWWGDRMTDKNGFASVNSWETNVDLVPGMFVVASNQYVSKDIKLESVLLFVFDTETDFLAGSAPPDRHVWVGTGNDNSWCSMDVTSGPDGAWEADFASQPCDVMADMWGAAQVFDGDGDATEANPGFPRGSHDYDTGDVPSWSCNAGGWAFDPDDQGRPVPIQIRSDGEIVAEFSVNIDGNRGFAESLWGLISSYEKHEITVVAYDQESDTWRPLEGTPKPLTCRTYDIYSYDPLTGKTKQVTNLRDADEYNPSWSPNGKMVAHDVVFGDGYFAIYITNIKTGFSTPLIGAEYGNDAVWSPNGKWIAFDRNLGLYLVPSTGGNPILVRQIAVSADWAPNGKRLVFQDLNYGAIRTIPVDGGDGGETTVAPMGGNPVWSPDGNWIAYEIGGDIWKVQVSNLGVPIGEPIQVTSGPFSDGQATWSPDSLTIVYHSGFTPGDWDLWSVPAIGGMGTWLTGAPVVGDYDPSYAKNSSNIAYASSSPEGQAERNWVAVFTAEKPSETWNIGEHSYQFLTNENDTGVGQTFSVSADAPTYDGYVLLRPMSLTGRVGDTCSRIDSINPNQPTSFLTAWFSSGTYVEAATFFYGITHWVNWDEDGFTDDFIRHEIFPMIPGGIMPYACTFTIGD